MKIVDRLKEILSPEDLQKFEEAIESNITEQVQLKTKEIEEKYKLISEEYCNTEKAKIQEQLDKDYATKIEEAKDELESTIVDKLDAFIDSEIAESISDEAIDKIAINEVAMPIVEKIKQVLEESYIAVDSDGSKTLSEKDEKIEDLNDQLNDKIAEAMEYKELAEKAATKLLMKDKLNGLTDVQKERVETMFESKSFDEVESKIDSFIKLVVEEENKTVEDKEKVNESETEEKKELEKKAEQILESEKKADKKDEEKKAPINENRFMDAVNSILG